MYYSTILSETMICTHAFILKSTVQTDSIEKPPNNIISKNQKMKF